MAATVTIDFNANLARFSGQIDRATADLNKFQTNAQRMAGNVKGAFAALGAGLAVGALAGFAKATIDAADSLKDMSERLGVSVKDLASLKLVAEQNGTSLEALGAGIQKLSLSFSQAQAGNKEMAASLKRLGIDAGDARERLFQLADAYASAGDKNKVLADAQKVLGKNYAEFIPLLAQGGDELRKAATASESFADAMARLAPQADKFNDQLAKFKENAAGAAATIVSALLPALNDMTSRISLLVQEAGGWGEAIRLSFGLGLFTSAAEDLERLGKRFVVIEQQIRRAQENRNDTALLNLTHEREDVIKQIKYLTALQDLNKVSADSSTATAAPTGPAPFKSASSATAKADPLASFFKATDTAQLKEYNELTAALLRRMATAKGDTTIYVQALDEINKKFADVNGIQAMIDEQEFLAMVEADGAKTAKEWADNLRDLANVDMSRLNSLLGNTDFARLKQDQEDMILLAKAFTDGIADADGNLRKLSESEYLDAVKNRLNLIGEEGKETKSIFEEMGIVMGSHLEDAISSGKDLSDVFKAMERDIINLIIRLSVMEPLLKGLSGLFGGRSSSGGGFDWGGIIGKAFDWIFSAKGNVFSNAPGLSAYSSTVVSQPTVFPFAKGMGLMGEAGPEAIMPLTRLSNGKLGVTAANDGGGVVVNVFNNANGAQATANERTDQNGTRIIDVMIEEVKGSIASDISQGRGAVPNALQATYALNRSAGAY